MLLIQQLTVAHVVIHIGSKGYIHGKVKDCDFKTSKNLWKIWKCEIIILYILKERSMVLPNLLYSKYILMFNELVIKNTHIQK